MAIVAAVAAAPVALATGSNRHHVPPAPVHFWVDGVATSTAGTVLDLDKVTYKPKRIGTATTFDVNLGSSTRYVNARGKAIASGSIKIGDRIEAEWTARAGSSFSPTADATRIVDLGPPPPVHFWVDGVATSPAGTVLDLDKVTYKPKSIGTATTFDVNLGSSTKYANARGKAIAIGSIKAGDRIEAEWTAPAGSTFNATTDATRIVDLGPPPPVHFWVDGVATSTATTVLDLDKVTYRPKSIGTATTFDVNLGSSTVYVNARGKAMAIGSIKVGDRIQVEWTEPAGSTFNATVDASRVRDLSRPHWR